MRRDRQPLHLHTNDFDLLLRASVRGEKVRRVRFVRPLEIALPKIVGLHQVEVAVQNEIALARHAPILSRVSSRLHDAEFARGRQQRSAQSNCQ
jgi:hypothetical protein